MRNKLLIAVILIPVMLVRHIKSSCYFEIISVSSIDGKGKRKKNHYSSSINSKIFPYFTANGNMIHGYRRVRFFNTTDLKSIFF